MLVALLEGVARAALSTWAYPPVLSSRAFSISPLTSWLLFLPALQRPPKPVALAARVDDVRLVRHAIQDRLAQPRLREDARPLRKRQVRRQDHRRSLRTVRQHLIDQLRRHL